MYVVEYESWMDKEKRVMLKEKQKHPLKQYFNNISNVLDFFEDEFQIAQRAEEYVYLIALNAKNRPVGVFEISHGSQTQSMFNVREICAKLLMVGAVGFMMIHNHPSGETTPSKNDLESTGMLKQACEILGLTMQDHIIIGDGYYSMKANGIIE